jgi:hypothetical protein
MILLWRKCVTLDTKKLDLNAASSFHSEPAPVSIAKIRGVEQELTLNAADDVSASGHSHLELALLIRLCDVMAAVAPRFYMHSWNWNRQTLAAAHHSVDDAIVTTLCLYFADRG